MSVKLRNFLRFAMKASNDAERTFSGLASTWEQDLGRDVIERGAYAKTLNDWKASKNKIIPLINQHRYYDVRDVVGKMIDAEETADGLLATFQVVEGADGDGILNRIKGGFINSLSIGYEAVQWSSEKPEGAPEWDAIRRITEVKLYEVSLVVWPMNENALIDLDTVKGAVLAVKSRGTELSDDEIDAFRQTHAQLGALIGEHDAKKGIAPDDPMRIQMEETLRDLTLRGFAATVH